MPTFTRSASTRADRLRGVDPRGQRLAAAFTSVVLTLALLCTAMPGVAATLLAGQALMFATGVVAGPGRTPYAFVFRAFVRPRIGPPAELEPTEPPRFAQAVGLAFAVVGLAGYASGLVVLGAVATTFALVAALLNATIGLCLGCEAYLLVRRAVPRVREAH